MKKQQFKTLMYCNQYVDANLLSKGIYLTETPVLYPIGDTIETLIERYNNIIKQFNDSEFLSIGPNYIENLKLCEMVDITINSPQKKYYDIL